MRILLVSATTFEIDHFIKNNKNIDVLISGVGTPVSMFNITKKLLQDTYEFVIQAGLAGTFSENIKLGEVVFVKRDAFADVGAEEKGEFKTIFQLGFADDNEFPFTDGRIINPNALLQSTHLKVVDAVTINRISDLKEQTSRLQKIFNADIESMEGAVLHYVCRQMDIPFLQMRSISNRVGERDKSKWKIKEAIENLNIELIKLAKTLS